MKEVKSDCLETCLEGVCRLIKQTTKQEKEIAELRQRLDEQNKIIQELLETREVKVHHSLTDYFFPSHK